MKIEGTRGEAEARARMLDQLCAAEVASGCELATLAVKKGVVRERPADLKQHYRDEACRLGVSRQCGLSVRRRKQDEKDARARCERRCNGGDGASCYECGTLLWDHARDAGGLTYFEKACSQGVNSGCRRAEQAREAFKGIGRS
jgi:hypothetical protein